MNIIVGSNSLNKCHNFLCDKKCQVSDNFSGDRMISVGGAALILQVICTQFKPAHSNTSQPRIVLYACFDCCITLIFVSV